MHLVVVGIHRRRGLGVAQFLGQRRIVAELLVMHVEVDGIEPEAIHPPLQPETGDVQQRVLHFGAVEVQVGLAGQEVVQVILLAPAVPVPGGAAEHRQPVVGHGAVGFRVGPDIPVGLGVVAAGAAFLEPGMLVRGM